MQILGFLSFLSIAPGWAATSAESVDGACSVWGELSERGAVEHEALDELSGLVSSPTQGVLWALNDSGGGAVLFALDADGADRGAYAVLGAENVDWEDLAAGPCEEACSCLYIADLGDQEGAREEVVIWRVPEPDLGEESASTATAEAIGLSYPDGAWDAETLLVDPLSGELFVIPKSDTAVHVYRLAAPVAGELNTLEKLTDLGPLDLLAMGANDARVTGGAVSPGGLRVVLRTNDDVLLFTAPDGGGVAEALATDPAVLPAPAGADGEAVAWSSDGEAILLGGEGVGSTLWEIPCAGFVEGWREESAGLCALEEKGGGCGGCASGAGEGRAWAGLALLLALSARRSGARRPRGLRPPPPPSPPRGSPRR